MCAEQIRTNLRFGLKFQKAAIWFALTMLASLSLSQAQQRQINGAKPIELSVWEEALKGRTPAKSHEILSVMRKVSETRYMSKTISFFWPSAPGAASLHEALIETTALDESGSAVGKPGYGRIEIISPDYRMLVVPIKEIAPNSKSVKVRILPKVGTAILETKFTLKWD